MEHPEGPSHMVGCIVEGMTFSLPHIFPNPCFLFVSGLNCMSLDYRFHLIYHAYCSGIFISHMLQKIVNKVRAILGKYTIGYVVILNCL